MIQTRSAPAARPNRSLSIGLALTACLLLQACASSVVPPRSPNYAPSATSGGAAQAAPRFAGVIGVDARALIRLFGEPRLDIRDPAARKLQFSDGQCVLDTYLYPPAERREPLVTFAEARTSEGTAMDWADCAVRLKKR